MTVELTELQAKVLDGVKRGLCNKLIARELGLTPKAAARHVDKLRKKLGVNSRVQVVLKVYEMEKQHEHCTGSV